MELARHPALPEAHCSAWERGMHLRHQESGNAAARECFADEAPENNSDLEISSCVIMLSGENIDKAKVSPKTTTPTSRPEAVE